MILVLPCWELAEAEGLHEPTSPGSCMRGSNQVLPALHLFTLWTYTR